MIFPQEREILQIQEKISVSLASIFLNSKCRLNKLNGKTVQGVATLDTNEGSNPSTLIFLSKFRLLFFFPPFLSGEALRK